MKVEIHSHTNVHSACSRIAPEELIAMAEATGYDALFLTEHHKVWSPRNLAELREWSDHVQVYSGIEISLDSGVDVLVLGAENRVYEQLNDAGELFAQACADDCLTVIAHPFRWLETLPGYCRLADAVELRTCNHPGLEQQEAAAAYAEQANQRGVYAADAHGLNFMNRFWIETTEPFTTPQEFRRLILAGKYENRLRDDPHAVLPPLYKAATMDELSPEDKETLEAEPIA